MQPSSLFPFHPWLISSLLCHSVSDWTLTATRPFHVTPAAGSLGPNTPHPHIRTPERMQSQSPHPHSLACTHSFARLTKCVKLAGWEERGSWGRRSQPSDAWLRQQSASVVQRHTMLPSHPWALSGRPISSAHSDVPGPHRPSQPEDGTVAVDNAPLCVGVWGSFGNSERLKLLFGSKTVYEGGNRVFTVLYPCSYTRCHLLYVCMSVPAWIFFQGAVMKNIKPR